jgi:hypothetical protein
MKITNRKMAFLVCCAMSLPVGGMVWRLGPVAVTVAIVTMGGVLWWITRGADQPERPSAPVAGRLNGRTLTHHIRGEITRMEITALLEMLDDETATGARYDLEDSGCLGLVLLDDGESVWVVAVNPRFGEFYSWEELENYTFDEERPVAYCEVTR